MYIYEQYKNTGFWVIFIRKGGGGSSNEGAVQKQKDTEWPVCRTNKNTSVADFGHFDLV